MLMVMKLFLYGLKINDSRKIAHGLKHKHGRCVVGAFDIFS